MLSDRGLQTEEQIKAHEEFLRTRFSNGLHGCISERICEKCKHLISDSICLCIGCFICPNCGHENGKSIAESMRLIPSSSIGTNGIVISLPPMTIEQRLDRIEKSINEALEIIKQYVKAN